MNSKKINYTARDYNGIREELVKFSQKYYPELSDSYNDSSVGSWMLDLVSAVGDDLSYHIDKTYQETNINSAKLKGSVLNMARINGVKIPGPKSSICEIEISCIIPSGDDITGDISKPNWKFAPFICRGGIVSNGNSYFELTEDVNFAEQFNSDGFSNRRFVPNRDKNGVIISYTIYKTAIVHSGRSFVFKKVIDKNEIKPFMSIILPEKNIMDIESIIFKDSKDISIEPSIHEYYIDEEEFIVNGQDITTYRYFEVDSLAEQYRFGTKTKIDNKIIHDIYSPEIYSDFIDDKGNTIQRIYKNEWKGTRNKFITEYTDNGYLKITFGSSNEYSSIPTESSNYAKNIMSNIINNSCMGLLPKDGWTMFCLYRTGGGTFTNISQGSINTIINFDVFFKDASVQINGDTSIKQNIKQSIRVTNKSVGIGGKDFPSVDEIKYLTKYNISSQNRCVTLKDYKIKLMSMPSKYGSPFRCNAAEENNKIVIPLLGITYDGKLDSVLPKTLIDNIQEFLKKYKNIGDYVEIHNGKIYNIGVLIDVFIDKNYDTNNVMLSIINKVKDYFDINKHDMGDEIYIGDIEKEITLIDGVLSVINFGIYSIHGGSYSQDYCTLPVKEYSNGCNNIVQQYNISGASCQEIDLEKMDYVLHNDFNSMFEIKYPDSDIQLRCKIR